MVSGFWFLVSDSDSFSGTTVIDHFQIFNIEIEYSSKLLTINPIY